MASKLSPWCQNQQAGWSVAEQREHTKPTISPLKGDGIRGRARGLLSESEAAVLTCPVTLGWSLHLSETQVLHLYPGKHKV